MVLVVKSKSPGQVLLLQTLYVSESSSNPNKSRSYNDLNWLERYRGGRLPYNSFERSER